MNFLSSTSCWSIVALLLGTTVTLTRPGVLAVPEHAKNYGFEAKVGISGAPRPDHTCTIGTRPIEFTECDAFLIDTSTVGFEQTDYTARFCDDLTANSASVSLPGIGDTVSATFDEVPASDIVDPNARHCVLVDDFPELRMKIAEVFGSGASAFIDTIERFVMTGKEGIAPPVTVHGLLLVYGDLDVGNDFVIPTVQAFAFRLQQIPPQRVGNELPLIDGDDSAEEGGLLPANVKVDAEDRSVDSDETESKPSGDNTDKDVNQDGVGETGAPRRVLAKGRPPLVLYVRRQATVSVGTRYRQFVVETVIKQCDNEDGYNCQTESSGFRQFGKAEADRVRGEMQQVKERLGRQNQSADGPTPLELANSIPGGVLTGGTKNCHLVDPHRFGRFIFLDAYQGEVVIDPFSSIFMYGDFVVAARYLSGDSANVVSFCGNLIGSQCSCDGNFFSVFTPAGSSASTLAGSVGDKCFFQPRWTEGYSVEQAEEFCQASGGNLASISSVQENVLVRDMIRRDSTVGGSWLGGKRASPTLYEWLDESGFFPDTGRREADPFLNWDTAASPEDTYMVIDDLGLWHGKVSGEGVIEPANLFTCKGGGSRFVPPLPVEYARVYDANLPYRMCDFGLLEILMDDGSALFFGGRDSNTVETLNSRDTVITMMGDLVLLYGRALRSSDVVLFVDGSVYSWVDFGMDDADIEISGDLSSTALRSDSNNRVNLFVGGDVRATVKISLEDLPSQFVVRGDVRIDGFALDEDSSYQPLRLDKASFVVRGSVFLGNAVNYPALIQPCGDAKPCPGTGLLNPIQILLGARLTIYGKLGFRGLMLYGTQSRYTTPLAVQKGARLDAINGPIIWDSDLFIEDGRVSAHGPIVVGGTIVATGHNAIKTSGRLEMTSVQPGLIQFIYGESVRSASGVRGALRLECGTPNSMFMGNLELGKVNVRVQCLSCLHVTSGILYSLVVGVGQLIVQTDLLVETNIEAVGRGLLVVGNTILANDILATTRGKIRASTITATTEEEKLGGSIQATPVPVPIRSFGDLFEANYCTMFSGYNLISTPRSDVSDPEICFLRNLFANSNKSDPSH